MQVSNPIYEITKMIAEWKESKKKKWNKLWGRKGMKGTLILSILVMILLVICGCLAIARNEYSVAFSMFFIFTLELLLSIKIYKLITTN